MKRCTILGVLAAILALTALGTFYPRQGTTDTRGGDKIDQSGYERRLKYMPASTGEQSELYEYSERRDLIMRVVFVDGWTAVREKNSAGQVTSLWEVKKDASLKLVYELDGGPMPVSLSAYRKDGTKCWFEAPVGKPKGVREIYQVDGVTLKGRLRVEDDSATFFTVFDENGDKRYEEIVPDQSTGSSGYSGEEESPPEQFEYFVIYNGAASPRYRQNLRQPSGESNFQLDSVEEFEAGSWQVRRRITPNKEVTVGEKSVTLTEVVIISDGRELYVRYIDEEQRILKMIDQTVTPPVTTEVAVDKAIKEDLDPQLLQSPETPAEKQLARDLMSTKRLGHLERLLLP